jgi:UPF0042 nucleotide-binding protein
LQVVIVTGLSGAGKTQAVICLEDMGYYCIDNIPPALVKNFIGLAVREKNWIEKAAFVMDIRGGEFFADIKSCLDELKSMDISYKLIFLEASEEALIRRFNETRRTHPLSGGFSTRTGIQKEKAALTEVRDLANYIIDTSNMKSMRLREEIKKIFTSEQKVSDFTINLVSFGFKNGIPLDADMVFDVRFIPNPYYSASLKKMTGNSKKVRQFVMKFSESKSFIGKVDELIGEIIPYYIREGKYHLNIAFGCTGGQHRSVAIANEFADIFSAQGRRTVIAHRDI